MMGTYTYTVHVKANSKPEADRIIDEHVRLAHDRYRPVGEQMIRIDWYVGRGEDTTPTFAATLRVVREVRDRHLRARTTRCDECGHEDCPDV